MMLKKTLHVAVAAIAVSAMCLPTAEAKEDLVLEAEGAKWYTVATESYKPVQSGELQRTKHARGTVDFQGKVLETHWSSRLALEWMPGSHILCEAGTTEYAAFEGTVLLRGSNPDNTLTMDTLSKEESNDPTNEFASVACFNGQTGYFTSAHWTYEISEATGKWSCAYIAEGGYYGADYYADLPEGAVRPFRPDLWFEQVEYQEQGTIIIPRPCEQ
jgi:hypothetical protein